MLQLLVHRSPGEFLDTASAFLEKKEVDNNLLLGLAAGLTAAGQYPGFHFLSVTDTDGNVVAASAKAGYKAIISADHKNSEAMHLLLSYYNQHCPELPGVFAESLTADAFVSLSGKKQKTVTEMIVHSMEAVLPAEPQSGIMETATLHDLSLLTDYLAAFDLEIFGSRVKTKDILQKETEARIGRKDIYVWKNAEGALVSMAVTVRFTRHIAVIGYVYTPPAYRGAGYASALVWSLSKQLLGKGYRCALFTEKSNPVSNSIYRKIGYVPGTVFSDISF